MVEIAQALDIAEVRAQPFDGFEGMLLTDRVRSYGAILANTRRGSRRARFTIGHELGHFLLEHHVLTDGDGFRCRTSDMRETRETRRELRQEVQANQFAIELLAPAYAVTGALSEEPDLRDANYLREQLDLSLEAVVRRMIELREEPSAAVWSKSGRVRYTTRSDDFPFVTLKRGSALAQTTAAFRHVTRGQRGTSAVQETHPQAWTERSNLEMYEQTKVLANDLAVTLLWGEVPEDADDEDDREPLGTPQFR